MSFRNLFVIHSEHKLDDTVINDIVEGCKLYNYGCFYKPSNYQDELISKINDCSFYFTITDNSHVIECDELFSLEKAFLKSTLYSKSEQEIKEQEFLQEQFKFMDLIINMIFRCSLVKYVDVYVSDQVSNFLEDYYEVSVNGRCLSKALANAYRPRKKAKYIGFKTTKFVIE